MPKEDRTWLSDRLQSVQQFSDDVQLQVVLGLLRGVLERLQKDHVHSDSEKPMEIDDTDEATSKPRLGALSRAKRTLANSFEGLRKKVSYFRRKVIYYYAELTALGYCSVYSFV